MRIPRSFLVACLSALVVAGLTVPVASAGAAAPVTRYVDDDGRGSLTGCSGQRLIPSTIQMGVDQSSSGDRVMVCPGVYVGSVTVNNVAGLRIRAVQSQTAIVRAAPNHSNNNPLIFVFNSPNTTVSLLRVEARTADPCDNVGAMIAINNSAGSLVAYNRITSLGTDTLDGACGYDRGVSVTSSAGTIVEGNFITNFQEQGIDMFESPNAILRDNKIQYFHGQTGSTSTGGIGILLNSEAGGVRVMRNRIRALASAGTSSPRLATGVALYGTPATARGNELRYVDEAFVLLSVAGARVRMNTAVESIGYGVRLYYSDNNTIADNVLRAGSRSLWAEIDSTGNTFSGNDADGSADPDCEDQSTGSGTAGTGNTWTGNSGTGVPVGICLPAVGG